MIKKTALIGIIILFTLLLIYCTTDEATIIGPFGNASKYISVANFSADKTLLYSNGDTAFVSIRVLDVDKTPAIGLIIAFAAQFGSITESDTTDSSGIALATFVSNDSAGVNVITADIGIKTDSLVLRIVHYQPKYVELFADSPFLLANGVDSTTIIAVVKDSVGNPMPSVTVRFSTTLGTLSPSIEITDSGGVAKTELKGGTVEGQAMVTATAFLTSQIIVEIVSAMPAAIILEASESSILADGTSTTDIIARATNINNQSVPGVSLDFSTSFGFISKSRINTDQDGLAQITLTSAGSKIDTIANVKAAVTADTSANENINIQFRGITSITYIDSTKMSDDGIYKAYIRTKLLETTNAANISNVAILFYSPVGMMNDQLVAIDENSTAFSVFSAEVLPTTQNDIIITSKLSSASEVSSESEAFDIPGAEILINTIGDYIMGDGEGWALVKATLHESDGNKAIPLTGISWSTTLGTIKGQSRTNTMGQTIDTLRIDKNPVSDTTSATITAHYGSYVSANEILTFIPPVNNKRLILGFEANISPGDSNFVACDIDDEFAIRDFGISALFVDENARGLNWEHIYFSVVPNNFARICDRAYTKNDGIATVMLAYPPQNGGEIIRVWGRAPDGTMGSIDIILPVVGEEDDTGGG